MKNSNSNLETWRALFPEVAHLIPATNDAEGWAPVLRAERADRLSFSLHRAKAAFKSFASSAISANNHTRGFADIAR